MLNRSRFLLCVLLAALPLSPVVAQAQTQTSEPFRYTRDDKAPGQLTTVRIDAARVVKAPINPNVFGNFLEHLGGVIYEGVWANALQNPSLERIEDGDKMPPWWDTAGATDWNPNLPGYVSPRAVRLRDSTGILSQRVFLPVHRIRRYTLTFRARVPQGTGKVTVSLRAGDTATSPVAWQQQVTVNSLDWQEQKFTVVAPASVAKGQASRCVWAHAGGDPVEIDYAEMFPEDAVDGVFDPDVLKRARSWRIPIMRYAGNFSSGYHWRDGVGPRASRPTQRNPAWGGVESNHFGTDEFLRYCDLIGAVPQIAVNAGNGTPQEAADWVRYVKAKRGKQAPRVWEIGNELYGGWQIGFTDPRGNAARYVAFRDAMRRVDANLELIATGKGEEFQPDGLTRNRNWNEALLRAASATGDTPAYLSLHPLVWLPGDVGGTYDDKYESAMAHPTHFERELLPSVIQTIRDVQGTNARTKIAPNEWGIIVGGDRWWEGPNHDVLAGAIFNALTLNAMLRHSDMVTMANMTAFMHGGGIKKPNGVVIVDPQYYTQQLYAQAQPRFPLAVTWSGPGRDVPRRGFLPAVANVPDVDVFAALTSDRKRLVAFVVNRHQKEARPVRLDVAGFAPRSVTATILNAPDVQTRNTWESPDQVRPQPFALPASGAQEQISVPAHSLVVLTWERR